MVSWSWLWFFIRQPIWSVRPIAWKGMLSPAQRQEGPLREYWSTKPTFTVLDFEPYPAITCFDKIVTTLKNWKGNIDTLSRWKISHMVVSKRVLCKKVATCFDSKWEAGWMMEGPSVNPSASIAVHYIHWPWRRDPLSSDAREGCDASSREKLLATSGEEGTQLQSYCNQLKLPGEN